MKCDKKKKKSRQPTNSVNAKDDLFARVKIENYPRFEFGHLPAVLVASVGSLHVYECYENKIIVEQRQKSKYKYEHRYAKAPNLMHILQDAGMIFYW